MRQAFKVGFALFTVAALAGALAAGCASAPLRTEKSTSGIRAAEEVGAAGVPQAALHLQLAREELAAARALSAQGERERADSMLGRAEADAELAVALSREEAQKTETWEALEQVRLLKLNNK